MNARSIDKLKILISEGIVKILSGNNLVLKKIIFRELGDNKKRHNSHILDVGCGTGSQARIFSSAAYLGIDNNLAALALARRHKNYRFLFANATKMKLKADFFDTILISGVLHHLSDSDVGKVMHEVKNVLKSKGRVLVIEAIAPLWKYNLISHLVRWLDAGKYIRQPIEYQALISPYFAIKKNYTKRGGVFDYAVFVLEHKK
jgi:ubiquinone/menaquinone biosynthesis C-methylase UbiE